MISAYNDNLIKEIFESRRSKCGFSFLKIKEFECNKLHLDKDKINLIKEYLLTRYNDGVDNLNELIYRLFNNIETRPVCKLCGKRVKFHINHYTKFCSLSCGSIYNADIVREKNKINLQKIKEDPIRWKKYIEDKRKAGNRTAELIRTDEKYFKIYHDNAIKNNNDVWNNYTEDEYKMRCHRMSEGWNKKFSNMTDDELTEYSNKRKEGAKRGWDKKSNKEKENFKKLQREIWKNKSKEEKEIWWQNVVAAKEAKGIPLYPTRISNQETEIYEYVLSIYPDTIRWYKGDKRYGMYECDIYVPCKDAFIECQYFKTHGGHPFDENNPEDINKIEKLKHDRFVHYDYKTFSIRDPHKRKLAKENNLNFLELWKSGYHDKQIVKTWLENLKNVI